MASCQVDIGTPAADNFSFDSAQYCGRWALSFASVILTSFNRGSTPSCRPTSRASASQVHDPELTQWYSP